MQPRDSIDKLIQSAAPEYIALKEPSAKEPSAPCGFAAALRKARTPTDFAEKYGIPNDPDELMKYYAAQGVSTYQFDWKMPDTGEVIHTFYFVDAMHCRALEAHELEAVAETDIWREAYKQAARINGFLVAALIGIAMWAIGGGIWWWLVR